MRKLGFAGRLLLACGVILALSIGLMSLFTEVQAAGRCICPMIYAPVKCDNGKTYSNLCVAQCHNAKNCVPIGPGPIE